MPSWKPSVKSEVFSPQSISPPFSQMKLEPFASLPCSVRDPDFCHTQFQDPNLAGRFCTTNICHNLEEMYAEASSDSSSDLENDSSLLDEQFRGQDPFSVGNEDM